MQKKQQKKTRQEINEESRELKRKRKHKGLPSGSRFRDTDKAKNTTSAKNSQDPRIGSKKPIPLIVANAKPSTNKQGTANNKPLSAEQELARLESDPQLEQLLDLVEQDVKLTDKQQTYLDNKLNRIEALMNKLGYRDDEFDEEESNDKKEDIISLLKSK